MSVPGSLYAELAAYYDQFCNEVDYAGQCAFARRVFQLFCESDGRDYFDLACGTGQHLLDMHKHGFIPHGLDNSPAMLALAARRCPSARLSLCDLAEFDHRNRFDLITCFLYSLHYSHPTNAVRQTLQRSFAALKAGGVLLFNAVDARGIQNDAGVTTYLQQGDSKLSFQSAWHYRGEGEVLDLNLMISRESEDRREQWQDHHTMTALTFPQLDLLLQQSGFQVTILEHDYSTMRAWDQVSANAIFVACKPLPQD